ncbi:hypothetical protein PFICI_05520 [Pestalotiopsis fici W106-1]|uniref:Cyclase n=1 Tax=Pestalotiopsis fici (strain W106-1 / CGMCC3.15140) TaxID=1229662 RepID=W3XC96_PESFW|nr:uncharacterized protein PFICI_05520 [Pestalotiopsis fici W106-1]ETS83644.1 hypothetical protein PFICI_05520 [Pestalotiopsis fici W106-1]
MTADLSNLPDFDSLPAVEGMPKGCAWGVFDKDGEKDTLGCLNLLTPERIRAAYTEARDGVSISLNASLDLIKAAGGPRAPTTHRVLSWAEDIAPEACAGLVVHDDEVSFNTQASSQWDGFCHVGHAPAGGLTYNGAAASKQALADPDRARRLPGLEHWHARGGVVGRGVLLDYYAYAQARGITYDAMSRHVITIEDLEKVAAAQGTELRTGDVLLVRAGVAEAFEGLTGEQQTELMVKGQGAMVGVEGNEQAAKWFWNKHFAAVASDTFAFEVFPPQKPDGTIGGFGDLVLHKYFLNMFGLNIGELWNLKALGEHCAKIGRYSFLLTSVPLNISGLVASPPNALALF